MGAAGPRRDHSGHSAWDGDSSATGTPPTAFALLVWAFVSWAVVAAYLPLAWDRYLLPIQAPNALLAAVGLSVLWDRSGQKAVTS